jgi:putative SOS response-associated peptidase YedK
VSADVAPAVSLPQSAACRRRDQRDEPDPSDLMRPFPAALMRMGPISTRVNKPENDDPSVVEPIESASDAA